MAIRKLNSSGAIGGVISFISDDVLDLPSLLRHMEEGQLAIVAGVLYTKTDKVTMTSIGTPDPGYTETQFDIPPWNMDTISSTGFYLNATEPLIKSPNQIIGVSMIIWDDNGNWIEPIGMYNSGTPGYGGATWSIYSVSQTEVWMVINRLAGGMFDDTGHDSVAIPRGKVFIKWIPWEEGMYYEES